MTQGSAGSREAGEDAVLEAPARSLPSVDQLQDKVLPYLVQAGQRQSEEWAAHWSLHVRCFGQGNRKDPFSYSIDFLQGFLKDTIPYFEHIRWLRSLLLKQAPADLQFSRRHSASHQSMASLIKGQQHREDVRMAWITYCNTRGNGKRDPMWHSEAFLQDFLAEHKDVMAAPMALGMPVSAEKQAPARSPETAPASPSTPASTAGQARALPDRVLQPLEDCAICLESPKVPMETRCRHVFCEVCILGWAAKRKAAMEKIERKLEELECPMCNRKLKRSDLRPLARK